MGINDRCAVYACNNARKYKDKYIVKPHISAFDGSSELRFWSCTNQKLYAKWTNACNRKNFSFKKHHVICSNHFQYGRPTDVSPCPTLYLKGYDETSSAPKRKSPKERLLPVQGVKKRKMEPVSPELQDLDFAVSIDLTRNEASTSHDQAEATSSATSGTSPILRRPKKSQRLSWEDIKSSEKMVKLYTGCPNAKVFEFIVEHVRPKHCKLQYYKGAISSSTKKYQFSPARLFCQKKPGPARSLSLEDEVLMTLMRIRLDAPVEDLAFRFGISSGHASSIITTFIAFLALELKPLIYWPEPDETLQYKHVHFSGTFNKCEGIGDCTEQRIEHSKNVDAQYQTYSTYKSNNTLKKLIVCTKSGSISFMSTAYGGSCTDRYITEDTQIARKFTPGMMVLFDKGFNVQDLFLPYHVKCVIPPFVRMKRQFTRSEVYHGKRISKARIHIERVIGRLKEFRILDNTLPITLIDLCDHIWTIAGAITNMQPPLVGLKRNGNYQLR